MTTLFVFSSDVTSTCWYVISKYLPSDVQSRVNNVIPESKLEMMVDLTPDSRRKFRSLVRHESIQKLLRPVSPVSAKYVHVPKDRLRVLKYLALEIPYDLYPEALVAHVESKFSRAGIDATVAHVRNSLFQEIVACAQNAEEFPLPADSLGLRVEDVDSTAVKLLTQERYLRALLNNLHPVTRKDTIYEYLNNSRVEEADLIDALLE